MQRLPAPSSVVDTPYTVEEPDDEPQAAPQPSAQQQQGYNPFSVPGSAFGNFVRDIAASKQGREGLSKLTRGHISPERVGQYGGKLFEFAGGTSLAAGGVGALSSGNPLGLLGTGLGAATMYDAGKNLRSMYLKDEPKSWKRKRNNFENRVKGGIKKTTKKVKSVFGRKRGGIKRPSAGKPLDVDSGRSKGINPDQLARISQGLR